jgi:hypothetical protein
MELQPTEITDATAKAERVAKSLFTKYYPDLTFTSDCYIKAGSFGKGTATKPRTDIDLIFRLPNDVYYRINALSGNKQSQLLQEVKRALLITYPTTDIRGDGPVVQVPFETYNFEVVPVFLWEGTIYITAHTADGGSWHCTNPAAEFQWLQTVDGYTLGKATHLIKMLKAWKHECNVDMKSICLETAAILLVSQWIHRHETIYYYDWMVRDFFEFLLRFQVDGKARPAGISEQIPLGDLWQTKCQTAYSRALKACQYERVDDDILAATEWQKIFGSQFHVNYQYPNFLAALTAIRS